MNPPRDSEPADHEDVTFDITPHVSILPKLGKTGYSVIEAISELVDNCIDARVPGKQLRIRISMDDRSLSIEDNAAGMTAAGLADAMTLGKSSKVGQLGSFGLGMKTACTSLGKRFEIVSTPVDGHETNRLVYDEEEWLQSGKWSGSVEVTKNNSPREQGTRIAITKLAVWYGNLVTNARREFGERYYPFLETGEVEIHVNNKVCTAVAPDTSWREDISFTTLDGNTVTGWIGAKKEGKGDEFGFNLYKFGRLVETHQALGFKRHPDLRLLVGELHLDHLEVTHNKREFIRTHPTFVAFEEQFTEWLEPYRSRIREESRADDQGSPQVRKRVNEKLELLKKVARENAALNGWAPTRPDATIHLAGEDVAIVVGFRSLGHAPARKVTQSGGKLEIITNADHPFYKEGRNKEFVTLWQIAEVLAPQLSETPDHAAVAAVRDLILESFYETGVTAFEPAKLRTWLAQRANDIRGASLSTTRQIGVGASAAQEVEKT